MRKTFRNVPILTGNELPGPRRIAPASYKGQLYLEHTSGEYYRSLSAGPEAEWARVYLGSPSQVNDKIFEASRVIRRSSVIFAGDSISANNLSLDQIGHNWCAFAAWGSQGRVILKDYAAVTNDTVQDLAARLDIIIDKSPDYVNLLIGTNNTNGGVPNNPSLGILTLPQTLEVYENDLILPLIHAGITPIVNTIPPRAGVRTTAPATYRFQQGYNIALRRLAQKYDIPLVDIYKITVDPATGDWKSIPTTWSADGLHPSSEGVQGMATGWLVAMDTVLAPTSQLPFELDAFDLINLATTPLFLSGLGSGTGGQFPSGWNGSGTPDTLISLEDPIAGDGLEAGKWLKVSKTAGAAKNVNLVRTVSALAAAGNPINTDDRIGVGFRFKLDNFLASCKVSFAFLFRGAGGTTLKIVRPVSQWARTSKGAVWFEATVPPDTVDLRFDISIDTAGTVDAYVGQMTWINLTTNSIPGFVELASWP